MWWMREFVYQMLPSQLPWPSSISTDQESRIQSSLQSIWRSEAAGPADDAMQQQSWQQMSTNRLEQPWTWDAVLWEKAWNVCIVGSLALPVMLACGKAGCGLDFYTLCDRHAKRPELKSTSQGAFGRMHLKCCSILHSMTEILSTASKQAVSSGDAKNFACCEKCWATSGAYIFMGRWLYCYVQCMPSYIAVSSGHSHWTYMYIYIYICMSSVYTHIHWT